MNILDKNLVEQKTRRDTILYIMRMSKKGEKVRGEVTQVKSTDPQIMPRLLLLFSGMILTQFNIVGKESLCSRGEQKREKNLTIS